MERAANGKSILIISNSPLHPSGVAGQCRHIVKQLWREGYDLHVIAYSLLTAPPPREFHTWPDGEQVSIYHTKLEHEQFRDMPLLTDLIARHKPACLILFDDPRRFQPLLDHSSFIRSKMPMLFITVWDTYLLPHEQGIQHFNRPIYDNFDALACISKQTEWFCRRVYEKRYGDQRDDDDQPIISYVGHGSCPDTFRPLPVDDAGLVELRKVVYKDRDYDFCALMVNQNMLRKKFPDLIEAWRIFYEGLPPAEASRCCLLLKTFVSGQFGTNLDQVIAAIAPRHNVMLLASIVDEKAMNEIYNLADVVVNISNAEGFGLSVNEGMLAGKPVIVNVTGGLFDQCGFVDKDGHAVPWTPTTKARWQDLRWGEWAIPLSNHRTIIGSPMGTPYLYDENCSIDDVATALRLCHAMTPEMRVARGHLARQFCKDGALNSRAFANAVASAVEVVVRNWKPRPLFHVYKA